MLLIDDDVDFMQRMTTALQLRHVDVLAVSSWRMAQEALDSRIFDYAILAIDAWNGTGVSFLQFMLDSRNVAHVLAVANDISASRVMSLFGKCPYLPKVGLTVDLMWRAVNETSTARLRLFVKEHGFSSQEEAVLMSLIEGFSTDDISERLNCKPSTVKTYLQRMYNKTGRSSQVELLGYLVSWLTGSNSAAQ